MMFSQTVCARERRNDMWVIGLTGGVGSGKSYVAHRLQELYGMELLIADELGHVAMEPGTLSFDRIVARFGADVVMADGRLDRKRLADLIFQDPQALEDMNGIVHPAVKEYLAEFINERQELPGTILLENAILYETGCDAFCDEVWYVSVPEEIRMKRLMTDRGYSEEKSCAIIASQQPESFFRERADRIIDNAGDRQELEKTLESLLSDR